MNIDDPERHVASIGGLSVLFVMATEHEYGPHLKSRLPLVGLRGITGGRAERTGFHDWSDFLHIVDEMLAAALDAFGNHVMSGAFRLEGQAA